MTVAGAGLYINQVTLGGVKKVDITATPTSNGTEISSIRLAQTLNMALGLSLPIDISGAKRLMETLMALDVGNAGESALDKLLDGVSQIGSGEKHFSEEGRNAVKLAVEEWITATDNDKQTKPDTLQALLVDGAKVKAGSLSTEAEAKDVWVTTGTGVNKYDDISAFREALKIEPAPTPPPVDVAEPILLAAISLGLLMEKVTNGNLASSDIEDNSLPTCINDIFTDSLNNDEKIDVLNQLGRMGFFGKSEDYNEGKNGVFGKQGKDISITYAGGTGFYDRFFKGKTDNVSDCLRSGIHALSRSYEFSKTLSTVKGHNLFVEDFLTAASYSERTISTTIDFAAKNLAKSLSNNGTNVTADQLKSLATTASPNNFVRPSSADNSLQITIDPADASKVVLSVCIGGKYKPVLILAKVDWEKGVALIKTKNDKGLWLLNFFEYILHEKDKVSTLANGKIDATTNTKQNEVINVAPKLSLAEPAGGTTGGTGQGANQQVTEFTRMVAKGTATLKELYDSVSKIQDGVVLTQTVTIKKDYAEKIGIDVGNWGDTSSKAFTLEEVARAVISKYDALNIKIFNALTLPNSTLQQKYDAIQSLIKDTGFGLEDYKVKVTIPVTPPATPTTPTTQEITVQQYLQGQLSEQIKGSIQASISTTTPPIPYKDTREAKDDCELAKKLSIIEIELTPAQATAIGFSQIESKKSYFLAEIIAKLAPSEATPAAPAQQVQPVAVTSETPAPAGTAPVDLVKLKPGVSVVSGAETQLNKILMAKCGQRIPSDLKVTITADGSEVLKDASFSAAKYAFESGKAYAFIFSSQSNSTATYNPFTRTF